MPSTRISPTTLDRLNTWLRPGWAHAVAIRRALAVLLAGLGVALLVRGDPAAALVPVVVAAHDLPPGRLLTTDDVRVAARESGTLPAETLRDQATVAGRTLAAPVRAGEALTDVRLLGPRLAAAATGDANARIVPIKLADQGVAELLREGDRVDVVATLDNGESGGRAAANSDTTDKPGPPKPTILAQNAMVVLVTGPDTTARGSPKDRVVMLAMAATPAMAVAAASLNSALTVIFH